MKTRAEIDWIPEGEGGRRRPPTGVTVDGACPYTPIIRFIDEPWPPDVAWSLVVEKDEASSGPSRWIADIRFLVDEAPHESLISGRAFELYEGPRCVARGRIVDDALTNENRALGHHELTGRSA